MSNALLTLILSGLFTAIIGLIVILWHKKSLISGTCKWVYNERMSDWRMSDYDTACGENPDNWCGGAYCCFCGKLREDVPQPPEPMPYTPKELRAMTPDEFKKVIGND